MTTPAARTIADPVLETKLLEDIDALATYLDIELDVDNIDGPAVFAQARTIVDDALDEIRGMRDTTGNPLYEIVNGTRAEKQRRRHLKWTGDDLVEWRQHQTSWEQLDAPLADPPSGGWLVPLARFERAHLLTAALRSQHWIEPLPAGTSTAMYGRPDLAWRDQGLVSDAYGIALLLDPLCDEWQPGLWNPAEAAAFMDELRAIHPIRPGAWFRYVPRYELRTPINRQWVLA